MVADVVPPSVFVAVLSTTTPPHSESAAFASMSSKAIDQIRCSTRAKVRDGIAARAMASVVPAESEGTIHFDPTVASAAFYGLAAVATALRANVTLQAGTAFVAVR